MSNPFEYPEPPPIALEPLGEVERFGAVSLTKDGRRYVAGWDELHRYGMMNHDIWRYVMRNCLYEQISELDTLKLLAGTLLHQNVGLMNANIKSAFNNPYPPHIPK